MIRTICHQLIKWYSSKNYKKFNKTLLEPKKAQLAILKELTEINEYELFIKKYPVTEYADWKIFVERERAKNPNAHFVPTSGSTHKVKWIPYTQKFKAELWRASSVWIHDLYLRFPNLKSGTHYWSLSWLPEDMRKTQATNDLDFFSGVEKYLLMQTMTVNEEITNLSSLKESMRATLVSLIANEVTLISVWSPTFLLELLEQLISDKDFFLSSNISANKKLLIAKCTSINPELTKVLFPRLILISAWATSSSKIYAEKIKMLFPNIAFEAKGLWATEGVVTIPFQGKFPLAVNSHFYEFQEVESGEIYPAWKLQTGMRVMPILTTGSLFFRYKLNDVLLVSEFIGKTPCLEFLGREHSTDMVGEKISTELAAKIILEINESFAAQFNICALSLLAVQGQKPHYRLLVEGLSKIDKELEEKIAIELEQKLLEHFHYQLARNLNQLEIVQVLIQPDAYLEYIKCKEKSVALKGNIKIEPLMLVNL